MVLAEQIIHGTELRAAAPRWIAALSGDADRERLTALIALAAVARIGLDICARTAFPHAGSPRVAIRRLSSFRHRINRAAEQAGIALRFCVDTRLKTQADARECWFTRGTELRERKMTSDEMIVGKAYTYVRTHGGTESALEAVRLDLAFSQEPGWTEPTSDELRAILAVLMRVAGRLAVEVQ
jgi:hypothetical protein